MDFSWASNYPDLQTMCKRFNLSELYNPVQVKYKSFKSIIQQGPQCGLVALAMCMESPRRETVDKLFNDAIEAGYTFHGEMFSCRQMYELAVLNFLSKVTLYEGLLDSLEIKEFLLDGGVMLVPYDCDSNHAPRCLKGQRAHWALITGIVVTEDETYILAKHGKSCNIACWSLSKLSESNAQLEEFVPNEKYTYTDYMLPEGGIGGPNGLRCKAVCIWKAN